jgi:hypothetical protein
MIKTISKRKILQALEESKSYSEDPAEPRKRNSILEEGRFVPLIKFSGDSYLSPIKHMIKPEDRSFLINIAINLFHRGAYELYLGGSAPVNWTFKGEQGYNDIDILVANEKGNEDKEFRTLLKTLRDISRNPGIRDFLTTQAKIEEVPSGAAYMNFYRGDPVKMGPTYRFVQIPQRTSLDTETPSLVKASPIEVSFFLGRNLEETVRELQKQV